MDYRSIAYNMFGVPHDSSVSRNIHSLIRNYQDRQCTSDVHIFSVQAISVTYSEGVFVALIFQYAIHMRGIFICGLAGYTILHVLSSTT